MEIEAMSSLESVLLICDEDAEESLTLWRAADLARASDAQLTVASLVEQLPERVRLLIPDLLPEDVIKFFVEWRGKRLNRFVRPVRASGVDVRTTILAGVAVEEVARETLLEKHDLVIVTPEATSKVDDPDFACVCRHLVDVCPCPVWLARPAPRKPNAQVLACLDLGPVEDEKADADNTLVLDWAETLARLEGSELHIAQAWAVTRERAMRSDTGTHRGDVDKLVGGLKSAYRNRLDSFLAARSLAGETDRVHLLKGEGRIVIPALINERRIDTVVVGSMGGRGLSELLGGSVMDTVWRQTRSSVVTVKTREAAAARLEEQTSRATPHKVKRTGNGAYSVSSQDT